ncbi:hypothetical protein XM76_c21154 [Vibrio vulnificus]|nr:hypothetical protein XM76_c21154 [Vibrio vulnificus]
MSNPHYEVLPTAGYWCNWAKVSIVNISHMQISFLLWVRKNIPNHGMESHGACTH